MMNVFSTVEVPKFKTVFLGETAVGKSSICLRIINNRFEEFIESTIGASFMNYKNEKACCNLGYSWSRKIQVFSPIILLRC